jgi:hypothetical protein
MAEGQSETRAEEVARIRSYLASQATRRTPAQLVEAVREAHNQFLAALALVPDDAFRMAPQLGEWSAADVLSHMRDMAAFDASAILAVIEDGEQPPDIEDRITPAPLEVTRAGLIADLAALRERLMVGVLRAEPKAHADITWGHPEFGRMGWREWLLFARVHTLDHARQLQAIAAAVAPQEALEAPEGGATDA